MKKVFISVGEVSADTYASYIVKSLKEKFHFLGIAGPKMLQAGIKPISKIDDISVVGITEALSKYKDIKKVFRASVEAIKGCDTIIAVDFPGFNIKLIQEAKKQGKGVLYFISPQIWAWHYSRIYKIVKNTDLMISILPFEEDYYRPFISDSFRFEYVGHPLVDIVKPQTSLEEFTSRLGLPWKRRFIGLLPGSRESEVKVLLPILLQSAELLRRSLGDVHFLLPVTDNVLSIVLDMVKPYKLPLKVITSECMENPSHEVMKHSVFSIIASGTATLEATIVGNPFLLVYRVSPLTFFIGKRLVKIEYLGIPNIIAREEVVKELLQERCNPVEISNSVLEYLYNPDKYSRMKEKLSEVKSSLGGGGAISRVTQLIEDFLTNTL